jgi:hypothetical protein
LKPPLRLHPLHSGFCQVLDLEGQVVGNLRLVHMRWKFKAIGFDEQGQVIPGGGPLTDRHNLSFDRLDETEICTALLGERIATAQAHFQGESTG